MLVMGFGSMAFAVIFGLAGYILIDRRFDDALTRYNTIEGPLAGHGSDAMEAYLRARRHEKDFLLAARKLGTAESRARYASLFTLSIEDLRARLSLIAASPHPDIADLPARVASILLLVARYESHFQSVVEQRTELGFLDAGHEGRMNAAARSLEEETGRSAPAHLAALLMLVRAEEDFILRVRPRDSQAFVEKAAQLRARLQMARLPVGTLARLESGLEEYERSFANYAVMADRIEAGTREYLAAAAALEPAVDTLKDELMLAAGIKFNALGGLVRATLYAAGGAALLVFGLALWSGWRATHRITASTRQFSSFATALARGESGVRLGTSGSDEFGLLGRSLDQMAEALEDKERVRRAQEAQIHGLNRDLEERVLQRTNELEAANRSLTARNIEVSSLSELSRVLLASLTLAEAYKAMPRLLERLMPHTSGRLYTMNASATFLELQCAWGGPRLAAEMVRPDECWALRTGTAHVTNDAAADMVCPHQAALRPAPQSLCVPLTAQNEGLGLLYIEPEANAAGVDSSLRLVAEAATEQLALGIASLRMREQLRHQSIKDLLTGLYNRRYLEEAAERELHLARRKHSELAVIMLDVDHFKKFNDQHGHEAGDQMLKAMGALIRRTVRASDIACRYGGEEFTVLMPETGREAALKRAETLRVAASELRTGALPPVTLSLGVALFPSHGQEWSEFLHAADLALYEAKRAGRNRVQLAVGD